MLATAAPISVFYRIALHSSRQGGGVEGGDPLLWNSLIYALHPLLMWNSVEWLGDIGRAHLLAEEASISRPPGRL